LLYLGTRCQRLFLKEFADSSNVLVLDNDPLRVGRMYFYLMGWVTAWTGLLGQSFQTGEWYSWFCFATTVKL